jgi:2-hydroxycyclohexanecarboxyl-CoA dehydrogenase
MELELKDKVAIVTGGGWGIGKAAAMGFADEGARVVIADLDEGRGISTVQELRDKGSEALFTKVDVSSWPEVEQAVASTVKEFGQIDILVNNAGAWRIEFFTKQPREDWAVQVDVCYYGTLNFTKAIIDHMVSRKTGSIINVASDAARVGEPNQPIYAGAKAAVVGFSKSLAKEVGRHGIRVNVVCPSLTTVERRVEMEEQMKQQDPEKYAAYEEQMKKAVRLYPMRKLGKPEDLANMIVFLASDFRAGHVTGQTISVNGGYCMV